jgi:hypothetical protein
MAQTKDPYQEWVSQREERRQTREQTYKAIKARDPKQAEQFLQTMERMEVEMEAKLNVEAPKVRPDWTLLQRLRDDLAALRRELAAMSRDESAAQAWYGGSNSSLSGLVPAGSPKARPLVAQNPDFFDRSRPCTDIQLITVRFVWEGLSDEFIGKKRLEEFLQTNDWKRLASLMDGAQVRVSWR